MRPNLFGRKFFGIKTIGAGALVALLSAGRPALAQSHDESVPVNDDADDDAAFKKRVGELEQHLNSFLTVDEDKKIHVRKEFQEGLPMPAAQMERMLQLMVKVGDDGELHIRNPEQIKPFMPQIEGFFKNGGAEKLKELKDKSPEERKAAIEKMMREQGVNPGVKPKAESDDDDDDDDGPRRGPHRDRGGERGPRGDRGGEHRAPEPPRPPRAPEAPRAPRTERRDAPYGGSVEQRLERIEKRLDAIMEMLRDRQGPGAERRFLFRQTNPGERGERFEQTPWGWRAEPRQGGERGERGERRRGEERRGERRGGMDFERFFRDFQGGEMPRELRQRLERLRERLEEQFGRGGDRREDREDREDRDEREERRSFEREHGDERRERNERRERRHRSDDEDMSNDPIEGLRDVADGIKKIADTLTPQDRELILKTLGRLQKEIKPEDLRDQGKLMQKIQDAVAPEDMPRFMEIAGEILGSPEGRALQKRVDAMIRRGEDFMQSDRGQQLEKGFERMNGLFGRTKEGKGLEKLFPPRAEKKHAEPAPEQHKGKLY